MEIGEVQIGRVLNFTKCKGERVERAHGSIYSLLGLEASLLYAGARWLKEKKDQGKNGEPGYITRCGKRLIPELFVRKCAASGSPGRISPCPCVSTLVQIHVYAEIEPRQIFQPGLIATHKLYFPWL